MIYGRDVPYKTETGSRFNKFQFFSLKIVLCVQAVIIIVKHISIVI